MLYSADLESQMKKAIFVFSLFLLLPGCLAGAFVAGGATAGGLVTDPREVSTITADEKITFKVNQRLANDPYLASQTHVNAVSYNQVVLLTGQAYDSELRDKAEQYAHQVYQVKRVFNKISLGLPATPLQRAQDVGITSTLKTKMFANRKLKSNNFKLVTEQGVVYILGVASRAQAELAVSIARNTVGVKKVVKLIQYKEE